MKYKKICISILLICLIALTLSSVEASNQTDTLTSNINVDGANTTAIENAINKASDGDTINLGDNKEYNLKSDTIDINKKVTIKGNNVTIIGNSTRAVFNIQSASDITIDGLTFINPKELPGYNGEITGKAINVHVSSNILITNCRFLNYEYGVEFTTSHDSTVRNSYFNGATTSVSSMEGTGTKAIQLMGSKNMNIINNTFDGQIYDSLSIASTSSNALIENNTFINNTFAIFYGGASTDGNKIRNNRFITCGMINETYFYNYTAGGKEYSGYATVDIQDRPYIGLQKASSNIEITGNEFIVKSNNRIIYSEAENTAHGFPSVIGDLNITGNTVKKLDTSVDEASVIFYHLIIVTSLSIDPSGDVILKDNNFTDIPGIEKFRLEFESITYNETTGDLLIPKAQLSTYMSIVYVKDGKCVVELNDAGGKSIVGEKISYRINSGSSKSQTTDQYGHIYIEGLSNEVKLDLTYSGSSQYYRTTLTTTLQVNPQQIITQISAGSLSVNAASAKGSVYKFTLKDASGKALASKSVSISFNGKIYTANTNGNGVASFSLPINTAGKYPVTLSFSGDSTYHGCVQTSTINIAKQATKLTVAKKTFKKSATKKVTAVLKDNTGKVLKSKKVTMKVNGKTYTEKTNSKGVATFKVKLTKKGTFKATTKFAGDAYYTAKSVTSKIVVK
ncbi:right-handed parallel beta-helix repeat-containing protein [Methanobrevibacter sp.]|uniref:right-handed parallel beta-helix repeat-containing protein n=1 Tax=Methanobrevibacter sp. TaxID=66852 RepID=UPI0025D93413|nr:Ig-like domain repeat protein [Methanobrevibacter sp.]MBR4448190.1 right-handed parallel beta-helix repeat-containing protein [Methanobrevibacter sp.]